MSADVIKFRRSGRGGGPEEEGLPWWVKALAWLFVATVGSGLMALALRGCGVEVLP